MTSIRHLNRRHITTALGLAITILFLALALRNINPGQVWSVLRTANYLYILPAATFTACGYFLRTARWHIILLPTKDIPWRRLLPVLIIGFAANNLLPARMGEFVRAYLLGAKERISKTLSFATVLVERVLDGLTLVMLLVLVSLSFTLPAWGYDAGRLAAFIFLAALVALLLLFYAREPSLKLLHTVLRPLPASLSGRLESMANSFVMGAGALRGRLVPGLTALSFLVWLAESVSYFLLTFAFPMQFTTATRVTAAIFVLVMGNLGGLIPSAPGYVGTFHWFAMSALQAFGIGKEMALSYAILTHAMQYVLVTGSGLIFLGRENLSLTRLRSELTNNEVEDEVAGIPS